MFNGQAFQADFPPAKLMRPNGLQGTVARPTRPFTMATNNRKKPELTSDQVKQVVSDLLLAAVKDGEEIKLGRGAVTATAKKFFVYRGTVSTARQEKIPCRLPSPWCRILDESGSTT